MVKISSLRAALLLFLWPSRFVRRAVVHDADLPPTPQPNTAEERIWGQVRSIVASYVQGFTLVIVTLFLGWITGTLLSRFVGPPPVLLTIMLQVTGAGILLGATITVLGWEIRSWNGNTLAEKVNRWWYRALYVLGTYALTLSLCWQYSGTATTQSLTWTWPLSLSQTLTTLKNLVLIVTPIIGVWVAIRGLQTWKEQLRGTTAHQTAHKVLRAVFTLRRTIQNARYPYVGVGEWLDREPRESERRAEQHVRNEAHAYFKRVQPVRETRDELLLVEADAVALWGRDAGKPLQNIYKSVRELNAAHNTFFLTRVQQAEAGGELEPLDSLHNILFAPAENDRFATELNQAVQACEDFFRRYLD